MNCHILQHACKTAISLPKYLVSIFLIISTLTSPAQVIIEPGSTVNIQAIVNSHPAGTHYQIKPGVYRNQTIYPKKGDIFEGILSANGKRAAILNGSKLLSSNMSSWTAMKDAQGNTIYTYNIILQTRNFKRKVNNADRWEMIGDASKCDDKGENPFACFLPEDLFKNNIPLVRKLPGTILQAGEWYLVSEPATTPDAEFLNSTIYMKDAPTSDAIFEISVSRSAFKGSANDVTVKNLVVEKYANPIQSSAIGDTWDINPMLGNKRWIIQNNEVRLNHAGGVYFNDGGIVKENFVHHNGNLGIGGGGKGGIVDNNEISYNKTPEIGYVWTFEGGGTKFAFSTDLVVRKNYVHHNYGAGLWTDINNRNTLYEFNTCTDNLAGGIFHEISFDAIIRNNVLARNSYGYNQAGEIVIASSSNVEVYNNKITVAYSDGAIKDDNWYGINISNADRINTGKFVPDRWYGLNNYVHHNDITYLYTSGGGNKEKTRFTKVTAPYNPNPNHSTGGKYDFWEVGNTRFNYNSYHLPDINANAWWWNTDKLNLTNIQLNNQELSSIVDNSLTAEPSNVFANNSNPIVFQRAINLGGSQITIERKGWPNGLPTEPTIESRVWEAGTSTSATFSYIGTVNNSQENIASFSLIKDISMLNESTTPGQFNQDLDANRSKMIRSWIGPKSDGTSPSISVIVPNGYYDVYLYVVEDNSTSDTYSIAVEGITFLQGYNSQVNTSSHYWQKLGPWPVNVTDRKLDIVATGKANFSGIEIRKSSILPSYAPSLTITAPTPTTNTFVPGSNITFTADATDTDGTVSKVEFFNNSIKIGEDRSRPYSFTWSAVLKGTYKIKLKATDNRGISDIKEVDILVYPKESKLTNRTEIVCDACVTGGGTDAKEAFDNNATTNWEPGTSKSWIQYQFANNQGYPVSEYTITSFEQVTNPVGRHNPKQWVLKGSNNGINYTLLDSRKNQKFNANETRRFYIINNSPYRNNIPYKYYRFEFYDDDWTLIIKEIDLYDR